MKPLLGWTTRIPQREGPAFSYGKIGPGKTEPSALPSPGRTDLRRLKGITWKESRGRSPRSTWVPIRPKVTNQRGGYTLRVNKARNKKKKTAKTKSRFQLGRSGPFLLKFFNNASWPGPRGPRGGRQSRFSYLRTGLFMPFKIKSAGDPFKEHEGRVGHDHLFFGTEGKGFRSPGGEPGRWEPLKQKKLFRAKTGSIGGGKSRGFQSGKPEGSTARIRRQGRVSRAVEGVTGTKVPKIVGRKKGVRKRGNRFQPGTPPHAQKGPGCFGFFPCLGKKPARQHGGVISAKTQHFSLFQIHPRNSIGDAKKRPALFFCVCWRFAWRTNDFYFSPRNPTAERQKTGKLGIGFSHKKATRERRGRGGGGENRPHNSQKNLFPKRPKSFFFTAQRPHQGSRQPRRFEKKKKTGRKKKTLPGRRTGRQTALMFWGKTKTGAGKQTFEERPVGNSGRSGQFPTGGRELSRFFSTFAVTCPGPRGRWRNGQKKKRAHGGLGLGEADCQAGPGKKPPKKGNRGFPPETKKTGFVCFTRPEEKKPAAEFIEAESPPVSARVLTRVGAMCGASVR